MAELQGLLLIESRKIGGIDVGVVGSIAENFQKLQVRDLFWRIGKSLYLWRLEKFGEYEGVRGRCSSADEVGSGAGGRG